MSDDVQTAVVSALQTSAWQQADIYPRHHTEAGWNLCPDLGRVWSSRWCLEDHGTESRAIKVSIFAVMFYNRFKLCWFCLLVVQWRNILANYTCEINSLIWWITCYLFVLATALNYHTSQRPVKRPKVSARVQPTNRRDCHTVMSCQRNELVWAVCLNITETTDHMEASQSTGIIQINGVKFYHRVTGHVVQLGTVPKLPKNMAKIQ